MVFQSNWKPSRTARKKAQVQTRKARKAQEDAEKRKVRKRDGGCRFPLCGCRKLGLRLEVSHDEHKGMGGNPAGDRSLSSIMVQLCEHRHQFGRVSRHKGTLRAVYLTDAGYDGPVAWEVDRGHGWVEVARERTRGQIGPLTNVQRSILEALAEMEE